jgi:hypothetical protein
VNETLAHAVPERFSIPKYVGARGWLGLWLDLPEIDWEEVEGVITEAKYPGVAGACFKVLGG